MPVTNSPTPGTAEGKLLTGSTCLAAVANRPTFSVPGDGGRVTGTVIKPMRKVSKSIRSHLWGIRNAIMRRVTNAKAEAINSRISG